MRHASTDKPEADRNGLITWACLVVNGLAILGYLSLVAWGFIAKYPAGHVLGFLVPVKLAPYIFTVFLNAALADSRSGSKIASMSLLCASLCSATIVLSLDYSALEFIHGEYRAFQNGAMNCGPPIEFIVGLGLIILAIVQLGFISFAMLGGQLLVFVWRQFAPRAT